MKPITTGSICGYLSHILLAFDKGEYWYSFLPILKCRNLVIFRTNHSRIHRYGLYTNWKAKGLVLAINLPILGDWSIWRTQ